MACGLFHMNYVFCVVTPCYGRACTCYSAGTDPQHVTTHDHEINMQLYSVLYTASPPLPSPTLGSCPQRLRQRSHLLPEQIFRLSPHPSASPVLQLQQAGHQRLAKHL